MHSERTILGGKVVEKWLGRQYSLPSGITDLIGISESNLLVVVEVKNVPINKAAVLQVCRYAIDLSDIVGNRDGYRAPHSQDMYRVEKILVGPSVDNQTFVEAMACDVRVMQFNVDLRLTLGRLSVSMEKYVARNEQIKVISLRDEWKIFGSHYTEGRDAHPVESPATDEYDKLMDAIASEQETTDSEE